MLENILDSHAHYDDPRFDEDRGELLERLFARHVCGIVNVGADLESSRKSLALAEEYPRIYAAVGVHPHGAEGLPGDYLDTLAGLAGHPKAVAIGEIGLDYHYDFSPRPIQKTVFEAQLGLAKELDLPVIIHSREATQDVMELLRRYRPKGVVHCFSGSAETAREVVELGMYVGFTGAVTFKNASKLLLAVQAVPMDRLLLETDCPYMAPVPYRGRRCDSSMIEETARRIGELKETDPRQVVDRARENTCRLFGIELPFQKTPE